MKRTHSIVGILAVAASTILLLYVQPVPAAESAADLGLGPLHGDSVIGQSTEPPRVRQARASAWQGFFGAPIGTWMRHRLSVVSRLEAEGKGQKQGEVGYRLQGHCEWLVLDRQNEEFVVRVTFPGSHLQVIGPASQQGALRQAAFNRLLEEPVFVKMSKTGRLLGYGFGPVPDVEYQNQVRAWLSAIQHEVRSATGEWTCDEVGAVGSYSASYRWLTREPNDRGQLERIREMRNDSGNAVLAGTKILGRGRSVAVLGRQPDWIHSVEHLEELSLGAGGLGAELKAHFALRMQLEDCAQRSPLELAAVDWDMPWESLRPEFSDGARAEEMEARRYAEMLRGKTLGELIQDFLEKLENGAETRDMYAARQKLVWMLRLDAKQIEALRSEIATGPWSLRGRAALLAALGSVQGHRSQETLVAFASDAGLDPRLRMAAMTAMISQRDPGDEVVQRFGDFATDARVMPELRRAALLMLGTFADRKEEARRGGGAESLAKLLSLENEARRADLVDSWLRALGNADHPRAIAAAAPYLHADSEPVRLAALEAYRNATDPQALAPLSQRLNLEPSSELRGTAAEILARRGSDSQLAALDRFLAEERSKAVRKATITGLGSRVADSAAARRVLENQAARDPEAELRHLALRLHRGDPE